MNTIYVKVKDAGDAAIGEAGRMIRSGGLVAFPTETVYGLGGNALDPASSKKIYEAKGRPSDNPLIVHIADTADLEQIAESVPPAAYVLAKKFWPGPLTMIFHKKPSVPYETTGGLDTVAVRFPSHPIAQALIKASGTFIAAPSANVSGRPSPTSGEHVLSDMDGRIDMIIDSGPCEIGLESTIIDMTEEIPVILRPGYVSEQMLRDAVGDVGRDPAVFDEDTTARPKAPGMRYRHYAPKGSLAIVSGDRDKVISYIRRQTEERPAGEGKRYGVITCTQDAGMYPLADFVADAGSLEDENEIASRLYDLLRRCDEEKIDVIFSEEFDTPRMGSAIMNRLIRAAGHNIIKL
ncbi:MAG: threonylcarbamoyl-AMP synthase [Lachnospiraceae bacterium]|nr:threonylcarbamoyl-AMP synthase [Lachnospiraceae bacterium]